MKQLNSILLIDDDDVTNYLHKSLIEELGIAKNITICTNGAKALTYLRRVCQENNPPELIFIDLNMPVLDGFGFLEAYKNESLQDQCKSRLTVLSSSVNPKDLERVKAIGIAEYIPKPLIAEHMHTLIDTDTKKI